MAPGARILAAWRLRRRAASYVRALFAEPDPARVAWLTNLEPSGDDDHARWELRYVRRSAALLAAQRDAVDDLTAAAVARALTDAFHNDRAVAPDRADVARRQFNERLSAYREVLSTREVAPTRARLGLVLLTFTGRAAALASADAGRAGEIVEEALTHANAELRAHFGTVALPEDEVPSAANRRAAGMR